MRYVCLVYATPEFFDRMSPEEGRAFTRDNMAYDKELDRSGHFVMATPLQSVDTSVTVRVRDKRISTTDGPFAETKEYFVRLRAGRGSGPRRGCPAGVGQPVRQIWERRGPARDGFRMSAACRCRRDRSRRACRIEAPPGDHVTSTQFRR